MRSIKEDIMNGLRKAKAFDSYNNYRNLYYARLYKNTSKFKKKFNLKSNIFIMNLQQNLGNYFENLKRKRTVSDINRKIISQLDTALYIGINKLQAKYSTFFPLNFNQDFYLAVQEDLDKMIQDFYKENKLRFNEESFKILQ